MGLTRVALLLRSLKSTLGTRNGKQDERGGRMNGRKEKGDVSGVLCARLMIASQTNRQLAVSRVDEAKSNRQ